MRYFFYDGDRIIAEREGNSWVVRHLVSLSSLLPVGFVSGGVRIYHADRLGSVRFVTDASQNILVSYVYEGFGKVIGQNGGGGGPYQFCGLWGYRNDHDAGLLHVGARYYEAEVGRFVQKDLLLGDIMETQTLNPYIYCSNDPINFIDPFGDVKILPLILVGILIIEMIAPVFQYPPSKSLPPHIDPPLIDLPRPPEEQQPPWGRPPRRPPGPRPRPFPDRRWRPRPRIRVEIVIIEALV